MGNPIALLLSLSARNIHQYTAKQSFNFLKRGQDHLLRSVPRSYLQQMNWGLKCWVLWLSFCHLRPAPYIHVARQVNEVRWLSCQPHQGSHGIWLLFHESDRFLLSGSWSTSDHRFQSSLYSLLDILLCVFNKGSLEWDRCLIKCKCWLQIN